MVDIGSCLEQLLHVLRGVCSLEKEKEKKKQTNKPKQNKGYMRKRVGCSAFHKASSHHGLFVKINSKEKAKPVYLSCFFSCSLFLSLSLSNFSLSLFILSSHFLSSSSSLSLNGGSFSLLSTPKATRATQAA